MNLQELKEQAVKEFVAEMVRLMSIKNITPEQGEKAALDFLRTLLDKVAEAGKDLAIGNLEKRYDAGYDAGKQAAIEMVEDILESEIALAHTTEAGKTSRLTSAYNRVCALLDQSKETYDTGGAGVVIVSPLDFTEPVPPAEGKCCGVLLHSEEGYGKYKLPPQPDKMEAHCANLKPCPIHKVEPTN